MLHPAAMLSSIVPTQYHISVFFPAVEMFGKRERVH
jgi:hypothetical protein